MDNFLTTLYFELFKNREREKKLMDNHDWTDDQDGHDKQIRNDQQITEVRGVDKLLSKLIKQYIQNDKIKLT